MWQSSFADVVRDLEVGGGHRGPSRREQGDQSRGGEVRTGLEPRTHVTSGSWKQPGDDSGRKQPRDLTLAQRGLCHTPGLQTVRWEPRVALRPEACSELLQQQQASHTRAPATSSLQDAPGPSSPPGALSRPTQVLSWGMHVGDSGDKITSMPEGDTSPHPTPGGQDSDFKFRF